MAELVGRFGPLAGKLFILPVGPDMVGFGVTDLGQGGDHFGQARFVEEGFEFALQIRRVHLATDGWI